MILPIQATAELNKACKELCEDIKTYIYNNKRVLITPCLIDILLLARKTQNCCNMVIKYL